MHNDSSVWNAIYLPMLRVVKDPTSGKLSIASTVLEVKAKVSLD